MERVLWNRFRDVDFKSLGLLGLSATDIECRESMCRLEMEYPLSLKEAIGMEAEEAGFPKGAAVVRSFVLRSGPLATMSNDVATQTYVAPNGNSVERVTLLTAFDEGDIDPRTYDIWLAAKRPQMEEVAKQIIADYKARRAGAQNAPPPK
jgi:hypothetical protein